MFYSLLPTDSIIFYYYLVNLVVLLSLGNSNIIFNISLSSSDSNILFNIYRINKQNMSFTIT